MEVGGAFELLVSGVVVNEISGGKVKQLRFSARHQHHFCRRLEAEVFVQIPT
jgi:hypothetical protein